MSTLTPTYTWSIANLESHASDGIVYTAHWTVSATATTPEGEEVSAGAYGSVGLEAPAEGDVVIPYASLTPEVVVGWVKEKLGEEQVTSMEEALTSQLEEKITPSSVSGLPW